MKFRVLSLALCGLLLASPVASLAAERSPARSAKPTVQAKKPVVKPKKAATKPRKAAKPVKVARPVVPAVESDELDLKSQAFLVMDQTTGRTVAQHNAAEAVPIASITKLMTAMVVLDAGQSLSESLEITPEDIDTIKGSSSRVPVGTLLTRAELLNLALMSSDNRAASALARNYPGGMLAFVAAMNHKAHALGLQESRFDDGTGLNPTNVSSARDLARMVAEAARYPLIRQYSTTAEQEFVLNGRTVRFRNTNALVREGDWDIAVSKTGYIREAGRCLVMQAWLMNKPMIIVLLDSLGSSTRTADAKRIKRWLEGPGRELLASASANAPS